MVKAKNVSIIALYSVTLILGVLAATKAFPEIFEFMGFNNPYMLTATDGTQVEVPQILFANACDENRSNCLNNVLLLQGNISMATVQELQNTNKSDTVCVTGTGGDFSMAMVIVREIIFRRFNTCLARSFEIKSEQNRPIWIENESCTSNCPWLLTAGRERTVVGLGLKIGIHNSGTIVGYKFPRIPVNEEDEEVRTSIQRKHFEFYDFVKTIPSKTMYYLSDSEVDRYNIFTRFSNMYRTDQVMDTGQCNQAPFSTNYRCPPDVN